MALVKLYDLARMTTATTGTITIVLGAAATVNGVLFLTFAQAGVSDGETVRYAINDNGASEIGYGVYTAAGTTLTRNVTSSTNSNNPISLSGQAQVFITAGASDHPFNVDSGGASMTLKSGITTTKFPSGEVLDFGSANYTITHSAGKLAFSGAATFGGASIAPATNGATDLGTTALMWGNLFLQSGGVINFNNGNYTLTHSAGVLTASSTINIAATKGLQFTNSSGGTPNWGTNLKSIAANASLSITGTSCMVFLRDESNGGYALVVYDGQAPTIISGSANFTAGSDPGAASSKWWIRNDGGGTTGNVVNRYASTFNISYILISAGSSTLV